MSVSILVVDDEPDVGDLFRQRFRREARQGTYVIHFAASGAEALDRLAGEIEPTLLAVLSDINMPGMDGLELLAEIKRRFPDLPVMMVTAYGDDERRRRAAEHGAAEFLSKPVDFDLLKAQLRQLPGTGSERNSKRSLLIQRGQDKRNATAAIGSCMRQWNTFETIATRMLAREGVGVIWDLHVRAAASYRRGNWLSAMALVGIADTAERLWRGTT